LRADLSLAQARARAELALVLSYLPPQTQVSALRGDLGTPPVPLTRDDLLRRALANRQELRAETRRLSQLDLEQKAAGRLRFPEPSLVGGLKRVEVPGGQNAAGAVIGVSIPIPLFNRGQTEVARLAAEKERARARADLLAQQIQAAVSGAYDLYVLRSAALQAFDNEMRDAAGLLRVARVGYQEGELGILQLLDAYRLERQRAVRRVDLQAAVKEAEIELSRSAGVEVTP
jgi:cobalt-zinc-cadmium efflux system outer membrane protein